MSKSAYCTIIIGFLLSSLIVGCGLGTADVMISNDEAGDAGRPGLSAVEVQQLSPQATDSERVWTLIEMLGESLENGGGSDWKNGYVQAEPDVARQERVETLDHLRLLARGGLGASEAYRASGSTEGQFTAAVTTWFEHPTDGDFFIIWATTDQGALYIEMDVYSDGYNAPLFECSGAGSPSVTTCTYIWTPVCPRDSWITATTTYSAAFPSNIATEVDSGSGECNSRKPV